jgi:hypothetical protein
MHQTDARGSRYNTHFYKAIRKHGAQVFDLEQLYQAKTQNELNKMETFFIVLHQSHLSENGYNGTLGGDGASRGNRCARGKRTPEQRERMSEAATRGYATGRVPWNKGNKKVKVCVPREEISRKQSLAQKAAWAALTAAERIRRGQISGKGQIGRVFTIAHRQKIAKALEGNKNRLGGANV